MIIGLEERLYLGFTKTPHDVSFVQNKTYFQKHIPKQHRMLTIDNIGK